MYTLKELIDIVQQENEISLTPSSDLKRPNGLFWKKIFEKCFTIGISAVIENSSGFFDHGKITKINYWGIEIDDRQYEWKDIVFIAQDGFPVRAINDMSYNQAVEISESEDYDEMRSLLIDHANTNLEITKATGKWEDLDRMVMCYGCPFITEDVSVLDFNWPEHWGKKYWGDDKEEEIVLVSPDGALMFSYDLEHHFWPR